MFDEKLIARFIETFRASPLSVTFRSNVGKRDKNGKLEATYFTLRGDENGRPVNAKDVANHFAGRSCLVLKPVLPDGTLWWASIDSDDYSPDALARSEARIREQGLPLHPFASKSGGAHPFLFLEEPAPATAIRALLSEWAARMGYPAGVEIFPKQDQVGDANLGNGIAVPFFGDPEGFARFEPVRFRYRNGTPPSAPAELEEKAPGLRVPDGVRLADVLATKLRFSVSEKGGKKFYSYHGKRGANGERQPCLLQGTVHESKRSNARQSSFVEENRRFWHTCFDSDCRSNAALAEGSQRGLENLGPEDLLSKTRTALLRLDELVPGPSVYARLCEAPTSPRAKSTASPVATVDAKDVKPVEDGGLRDMPEAVLDGRLGELCRERMLSLAPLAYAWPSIVTVAGAMTARSDGIRTNLYTGLVGPVNSGKSRTNEHARWLLNIGEPPYMKLMSGSAEGLMRELDRKKPNGDDRLIAIDELGHLLAKGKIEGSSFPYILNRAYYDDFFTVTMARNTRVEFGCRLSILGGIVDENFEDCFSANTTGGLYDRFVFGLCPRNFTYDYRPFDGLPAELPEPLPVEIDPEVWEAKSEWLKSEPLNPRVVENALRIATTCAAFDGRRTLAPMDLAPALATIRYQTRVRKFLMPNSGRNYEGILAQRFLAYLEKHAPDGRWVSRSKMLQFTHAYDFGPSIANRAISELEYNGEIEKGTAGKQRVLRRAPPQL